MEDLLVSLRELNRRFLAIGSVTSAAAPLQRLAALGEEQRAAMADCPYALFDIRFGDEAHWSGPLRDPGQWHVADAPPVAPEVLEFVRLALFYVWHVASSAPLQAQLLLGMPRDLVALFASQTLDRLPPLAVLAAGQLTPRWHTSEAYWNALLDGALRPGSVALRRAQLRGIQYAAAQRFAHFGTR